MTTIDFRTNGTFQGSEYNLDGVTITGSADVVDGDFSLGIQGGTNVFLDPNQVVNTGETIAFSFDSGAATDVSYFVNSTSGGGTSLSGEATIEAFGVDGTSLGTRDVSGGFDKNVSQLFGGVPISKFQVLAKNGDSFGIESLSFTPTAPNQSPDAFNDTATTNEDTPVSINVLSNDIDPDGDTLSIDSFTQATNGTVLIDDNGTPSDTSDDFLVYTPNSGYSGADSFNYTISDGNGGTSTATVNLTVNAVNRAPFANPDTQSTNQNAPLTISGADLLFNDSDADGDTLSITGVSNATGGTVSFSNGDVLFTPNEDFTGDASFNYSITDGQESATTTVTVTVTPVAGINRPGTNGNNTITGGLGRDTLNGGNGDDIINGGAGGDTLRGDNGNDTLIGGTGSDTVTGGNGNDVFVLAVGDGMDTITDFKIGPDKIGLSGGLTFGQLSRSGNTISAGGETLATLTGINTANLTQSSFITV